MGIVEINLESNIVYESRGDFIFACSDSVL